MKAVILAAGLGSRLFPITNEIPKCMVRVNEIRIIDKQIDNLLANGIEDIYVVGGYKASLLANHLKGLSPRIHFVVNHRYAETNNMYSLFLVAPYVNNDDFLLMNSDVYFDKSIIAGMLKGENLSKIACDKSVYFDESMKVTFDGNKINHISKNISAIDAYAVSTDIYRICAEDSKILFKEIKDTIVKRKEENLWTEVALDKIFKRLLLCQSHRTSSYRHR